MEKEKIYFNDTCDGCPVAGSAECLIFCGDDIDAVYAALDFPCFYGDDDRVEYNREISEQLQDIDNDLPF